jgi:hypothetical protein
MKLQETTILHAISYGCGNWSLILRDDYRLWVFGNRVLKRILSPKRVGIRGGYNELYIMHSTLNINDNVKDDKMGRAYRVPAGKTERKRPPGKP